MPWWQISGARRTRILGAAWPRSSYPRNQQALHRFAAGFRGFRRRSHVTHMINFSQSAARAVRGPFEEVAGRVDNPSETTSRFGGIIGATLLMAVLFALVLGVYGAVSINAFRPVRLQQAAAPMPSPPAAAPQVAPAAVAIPAPPQLDQVNPAASRTMPAPLAAVQPTYWVEYGAYRGSFYADKLVERLGALGINAAAKRVPGADGRLYFSVRSNTGGDRSRVEADAKLAAQLEIAPLIHRGNGGAVVQPVAAKAEIPANAQETARYWVQFGAYNAPHYALALREQLRRAGVDATIVERHQPGYARYVVRSAPSLSRDAARTLATHSESILGILPLVGRAAGPTA